MKMLVPRPALICSGSICMAEVLKIFLVGQGAPDVHHVTGLYYMLQHHRLLRDALGCVKRMNANRKCQDSGHLLEPHESACHARIEPL